MKTAFFHRTIDILLLLCLVVTGFAGLFHFRYQPEAQFLVVILFALVYVLWGVNHHHHASGLTWQIILEYSAVALIGSLLFLLFLVYR